MRKEIKIGDTDFTRFFTPTGYTVSYKKIRGPNSGYMLDGSKTDDVVTTKAVITGTCMPLNEDDISDLLSAVSGTYVTVRFYDPKEKGYRTATMMPSDPTQEHRGTCADGLDYWTGTSIQFTEK